MWSNSVYFLETQDFHPGPLKFFNKQNLVFYLV